MTALLIPTIAVALSFLVNVLADIRNEHKIDWSKMIDHSTRLAIYLACIGALLVVGKNDPQIQPYVTKFAGIFALSDLVGVAGTIKQTLGKNDPLSQVIDTVETEKPDPFSSTKK